MPDKHPGGHDPFEKALSRELAREPDSAEPCPDPEVVAAFYDHALPAEERRVWETHFATCARCQAHLAAMVRAGEPNQLDHEDSVTAEPRAGWGFLDWRWMAPVATVAIVLVAVWGIDPDSVPPASAPRLTDEDVSLSQERVSIPEPLDTVTTGVEERERDAVATNEPVLADEVTTAAAPAVARERQERADSLEPATVSAAASPDAERRLSVESFEARSAIAPVSAGLSETSPTLVVVAPDGATTWQVTASGIEKSTDGGSSWTQQTGLSGDVTAGAAPSASVCWLVGRRGFILRTVDGGGSWLQLGAPSDADVIGIEALDGERAVVELADGRTLRTEDGGMTWQVGQASR